MPNAFCLTACDSHLSTLSSKNFVLLGRPHTTPPLSPILMHWLLSPASMRDCKVWEYRDLVPCFALTLVSLAPRAGSATQRELSQCWLNLLA